MRPVSSALGVTAGLDPVLNYLEKKSRIFAYLDAFIAEALLGSWGSSFASWLGRRSNAAYAAVVKSFHEAFLVAIYGDEDFLEHFRAVALTRMKSVAEAVGSEKKHWVPLDEADKKQKWKDFLALKFPISRYRRFFEFISLRLPELKPVHKAWITHKTQSHRRLSLSLFPPGTKVPDDTAILIAGVGVKRERAVLSMERSLSGLFVPSSLPPPPRPPSTVAATLMSLDDDVVVPGIASPPSSAPTQVSVSLLSPAAGGSLRRSYALVGPLTIHKPATALVIQAAARLRFVRVSASSTSAGVDLAADSDTEELTEGASKKRRRG